MLNTLLLKVSANQTKLIMVIHFNGKKNVFPQNFIIAFLFIGTLTFLTPTKE